MKQTQFDPKLIFLSGMIADVALDEIIHCATYGNLADRLFALLMFFISAAIAVVMWRTGVSSSD